MSDPRDPNRPGASYPQPWQPPEQPTPGPSGGAGADFALRLISRPRPRLGPALAGLGGGTVIAGILIWGAFYILVPELNAILGTGSAATSRHYLAALAAFGAVVVGYVLALALRRGPLATAGVALSLAGVPLTVLFLTYDTNRLSVNADAIGWASIVVYLATFAVVPGLRGRPIYVYAALSVFTAYIIAKVAPDLTAVNVTFQSGQAGTQTGSTPWGGVAAAGLCFGLVYYLAAWRLEIARRPALAGAVGAAGLTSAAVGLIALFREIARGWVGLVLLVFGVALASYGAHFGRRITTWFWAAVAVLGTVLILSEIVNGSGVSVGGAVIVLGGILVVAGVAVGRILGEPDDLERTG